MNNTVTVWLIVAAILVVLGLIVFTVVLWAAEWDIRKLSTVRYETESYDISDGFKDISIESITADIDVVPSETGEARVVCFQEKKIRHKVSVNEGALEIKVQDSRKWYDHISLFSFGTPKITVYLPKSEYAFFLVENSTGDVEICDSVSFEGIEIKTSTGDVSCFASAAGKVTIKTSTGDIKLDDIKAGSVELSVSTGDIIAESVACDEHMRVAVTTGDVSLSDITCESLSSNGNTGSMDLSGVIVQKTLSIERSTGDITLSECDAYDLYIKTDTGDVTGNLLTPKLFVTDTSTGGVRVPESEMGGRCEITTSTGDIEIEID